MTHVGSQRPRKKKKKIYIYIYIYAHTTVILYKYTRNTETKYHKVGDLPLFFTLKMYVQCIKVQSIAICSRTLKKLQICPWVYYNLQYFYTLYDVKKGGISYVNVVSICIHVLV